MAAPDICDAGDPGSSPPPVLVIERFLDHPAKLSGVRLAHGLEVLEETQTLVHDLARVVVAAALDERLEVIAKIEAAGH